MLVKHGIDFKKEKIILQKNVLICVQSKTFLFDLVFFFFYQKIKYVFLFIYSTSQTKRGHQIPGYGGYIGGYNIEGIDDVNEKFEPYTVVRTEQPKLPDPNL